MTRILIFGLSAAAVVFGCARVNVGGTKEPIKVDISMRLDVYQHVQKDIDSIENIVSGRAAAPAQPGPQGFLGNLVPFAYAQEGLSPEVEAAALRRQNRLAVLSAWQTRQVVGENRQGLVAVRDRSAADSAVESLVSEENADRMIIYRSLAAKYGQSLDEIQKVYAERLSKQAPAGTPIEVFNPSTGAYEWKTK